MAGSIGAGAEGGVEAQEVQGSGKRSRRKGGKGLYLRPRGSEYPAVDRPECGAGYKEGHQPAAGRTEQLVGECLGREGREKTIL